MFTENPGKQSLPEFFIQVKPTFTVSLIFQFVF